MYSFFYLLVLQCSFSPVFPQHFFYSVWCTCIIAQYIYMYVCPRYSVLVLDVAIVCVVCEEEEDAKRSVWSDRQTPVCCQLLCCLLYVNLGPSAVRLLCLALLSLGAASLLPQPPHQIAFDVSLCAVFILKC